MACFSNRIRLFATTLLSTGLLIAFSAGAWGTVSEEGAEPGAQEPSPAVPTPNDPVPGGLFVVELAKLGNPTTTRVSFADGMAYHTDTHAIVAIPLSTEPGEQRLTFSDGDTKGTLAFEVQGKQYTEQHITLENRAMVNPPEETLARIRKESQRQRALYASVTQASPMPEFKIPLVGITTSLFGHRRFFNGQPRRPHSGLDIAADTGTPIAAAGAGRVVLADDLYFNGNTIFVDHGQGLITMYCHMSELKVAEGDQVEAGDIIGLVGSTGRSTGPHLHWTVSLGGHRVDPEVFLVAFEQANSTPADVTGPGPR